jgi:hypothetical protein
MGSHLVSACRRKYDRGSLIPTEEGPVTAIRACAAAAVAIAIVAVVGVGTATGARASGAAGVCKSFSSSGLKKIEWSAIGNVTCAKAKPWLLKLLADHGKPDVKVVLKNGPKGFKCAATDDGKGRPSAGACYTGTVAFPKNGFQWFG